MARSKKLRATNANEGETINVDMSPMIDCVFLLIMFFMVNANLIIVRQDKNVTPSVASASVKATDARGRIVVNVYSDGGFATELSEPLSTEDEIAEWIRREKERVDLTGAEPKLHLRGDREAAFKHSRTAIRAAARMGVNQVVFSVYQVD